MGDGGGGLEGKLVLRKNQPTNQPRQDNSGQALVQDSPEAVYPMVLGFRAVEIAREAHTPKSSMAAMFGTRWFDSVSGGVLRTVRNNLI